MLGVRTPALPASLRRTNERTVVSLLMRMGAASRADLAKAAGISQPTSGKIITRLLDLGVLAEVPNHESPSQGNGPPTLPRLGRPGQMLTLDSTCPRFVAIELGVSEICVSGLPVALRTTDEWQFQFPTPQDAEGLRQALRRVARRIAPDGLWGVLVSVPGIVDESGGKALFCPNLHWLEKTDLPELIASVWHLPVLLVQEIRALAVGHLTSLPARESFFLVDFGHGVGGAMVSDGALYSPAIPLSGEFGHTPVPGNDRRCGCGATGCLETLVSYRGLLESYSHAARQATADWPALVKHVMEHGLESWLSDALDHTARVIAGALNVAGINQVVVTGSLAELPQNVFDYMAQAIKAGALWGRFGQVQVLCAPHQRAAGLVAVGLDKLIFPDRKHVVFALNHAEGNSELLSIRRPLIKKKTLI